MTEKAIVLKIDKDIISVTCSASSQCKDCSMCSSGKKNRIIKALNPDNINLDTGNEVLINLPVSQTIFSSFMVLIFPLLFFILSYYLSGKINNAGEGLRALLGIAGMALAFIISFGLSKIMKKSFMPSIIKKIDQEL